MKKVNLFMQMAMFVSLVSVKSSMLYGETVFTAEDNEHVINPLLNMKPNENGEYVFKNGCYYKGDVEDGMMHGEGEIICPNNRYRLAANFEKGAPSGKVEVTFSNGNKVVGILEKGILQKGKSEFIPKNGVPCKGEFKEDEVSEDEELEFHCYDSDVVYKEKLSPMFFKESGDENL